MGTDVLAAVWKLKMPRQGMKLVLVALADNANNSDFTAWPSVGELAEKASMTERGVQKILRELERQGYIHTEHRTHDKNPNVARSSLYTVLPPDLFQGAAPKKIYRGERHSPPPEYRSPRVRNAIHHPPEYRSPLIEPSENRQLEPSENQKKKNPAGFSLTAERRKEAQDRKLPIAKTWAAFIDHHEYVGTRPTDAAWRGWCRKAAELRSARGGRAASPTAEEAEADALHSLMDYRDRIAPGFREPEPGEKSDDYRAAIDAEQQRRRDAAAPKASPAEIAAAKEKLRNLADSKRVNR